MKLSRISAIIILSITVNLIFVNIIATQKLPWAYTLYPYGVDYNDTITARDQDYGSGMVRLPFGISFMGHKFNQIWVHHAGFLAFQPEAKFTLNDDWPHPNYPHIDDPIFISPFYSRIELANDRYLTGEPELDFYRDDNYGRVMYRYVVRPQNYVMPPPNTFLEGEEKLKKQAVDMLNMAQDHIRDSISGAEGFVAEYAVVATWGNVTFLGISERDLEKRPRNSYQVVLVTDIASNLTCAIFNYEKVEWAASTEFGGNSQTGLSNTRAAKIGFNRGNGTEFFKVLPYSDNPTRITELHRNSNVNYRGRYIFRVDEWVQPAGCKNEYSNGSLFIWPRFGNMLGGQEVNITGPCFGYHPDPTSDYFVPFEKTYCRWGDDENSIQTMGEVITMLRARCVMPLMYFNGRINLWVSTDGARTFSWKAEFTVVDPIRAEPKVELVNVAEWYKALPSSKTLEIRWEKGDLGWGKNEKVEVQLFGYYEEDDGPHFDFLQKLGPEMENTGNFEFNIQENWSDDQNRARRYRMGAIAVVMQTGGTSDPRKIWSALQPLGWWRHHEMDIYYDRQSILLGNTRGRNWMEDQCRWWHEYQRWDKFWMYDLEKCPCTINFAVSDIGRWAPDPECNMDRRPPPEDPTNCQLHVGAVHCVLNIKPTVSGGGSRCCYNYQGNLMYTNDTRYGSTSDRYHIFGIPPYNVYGRVPALSHYLNDMVPYYLCCEWTDLCDSYLFVRETAECKGYRYPKSAAIYGDPHVMTFDGKDYSFNARGEFRLLISTRHNFILQGRFERPPNASFCAETTRGQINATRLTAIVAREDFSDTIEIRSRIYPNQTWRFKCDLYINGRQWWANYTEEKLQFFRNVSIVSPHNDRYMSNLTIMFNTSGAGVQVSCEYGMLHVKFSAPPVMFYETEGLLGYWNNKIDDEFRTPGGNVISIDSSDLEINKQFGMKWRVELAEDSLFTYSGSLSFAKFHDQKENIHSWMQFVPWLNWQDWKFPTSFLPTTEKLNFTESEMISKCDGDEQCLYDAKAIGILEVGEMTKNNHRYYKFLDEAMKPVNSCGIIPIKGGIRRTTTGNYLAGSRMTVTCESGYTFYGWSEYICNPNGTWLPTNNVPLSRFRDWPVCEHRHITGMKWSAVGISILLVLLFIGALVFYLLFQRKDKNGDIFMKKGKGAFGRSNQYSQEKVVVLDNTDEEDPEDEGIVEYRDEDEEENYNDENENEYQDEYQDEEREGDEEYEEEEENYDDEEVFQNNSINKGLSNGNMRNGNFQTFPLNHTDV